MERNKREEKQRGKRNGSNRDREGRSADNVATTGWLIPFYHTKHCALDADKNTQSNKQKEKKRESENLTQFYLDHTGSALGRRGSEGRMEDRKENTLN